MDLDRFLTHSHKVETTDLDWDLAARIGLTDDEAALLGHAADIEDQTPFYARELMNTPARFDRDTVGFVTMWAYEEYFHARAIHQILRATGRAGHATDAPAVRRRATARARFEEIAQGLLAHAAPDAFTALYFTWGTTQELLTTMVYEALGERTANPVLATLARRIARQERRHFAWYQAGARRHLTASRLGQRLTRSVLDRAWTPVGIGVKREAESARVIAALFDGDLLGLFQRIQDRITVLPGLAAVDGVRRYGERATGFLAHPTSAASGQAAAEPRERRLTAA